MVIGTQRPTGFQHKLVMDGRPPDNLEPDLNRLMDLVCFQAGLTPEQIRGKRRPIDMTQARKVICIWLFVFTNMSFHKIGAVINKDHTSVMHLVGKIPQRSWKDDRSVTFWEIWDGVWKEWFSEENENATSE